MIDLSGGQNLCQWNPGQDSPNLINLRRWPCASCFLSVTQHRFTPYPAHSKPDFRQTRQPSVFRSSHLTFRDLQVQQLLESANAHAEVIDWYYIGEWAYPVNVTDFNFRWRCLALGLRMGWLFETLMGGNF